MKKVIALISFFTVMFVFLCSCSSSSAPAAGLLRVSFMDVGQADCILVQAGSSSMLIDAGNSGDSGRITGYLRQEGIKKLDFLIGTHPHEDHIGSMDTVINSFAVGTIYMPKVITTTEKYKKVIQAVKARNLKISSPVPGTVLKLGGASCTILAPNSSKYKDLNNYSIVLRLTYGKSSFLFMGDAETLSEKEILAKGYDVKADVLKPGHHGSSYSTSSSFLRAVAPKYAIISVGKGNRYGHPSDSTLKKLDKAKVQVFRTDLLGTVVATSDGNSIKFEEAKGDVK